MSPSEIATWGIPEIPTFKPGSSPTTVQPWCPSAMAPASLATSPLSKLSPQQRRFSQANATTKNLAHSMIFHALQSHIENIDPDKCEAGGEDAFFVCDLGEIYRQHMRWKVNLPRIEPFYGM